MTKSKPPDYPEGIGPRHTRPGGGTRLTWYRTIGIGLFLILGLAGLLGGGQTKEVVLTSPVAQMALHIPQPVRNGMVFEWRIGITARQPLADAVIAVPANLWHDMTINSLVPAATEEEFKDGEFRFRFGALKAGDTLLFKVDGQLNPTHLERQRGDIRLLDGDRELLRAPVDLKVLL